MAGELPLRRRVRTLYSMTGDLLAFVCCAKAAAIAVLTAALSM
jgi:hypothetical protein